jgi:hypothetical protein
MINRRQLWEMFNVFVACLVFVGCGSEVTDEPGNLDVRWVIGGSTCAGSDVTTVHVTVYDADGFVDGMTVPCQMGQATLESLEPAVYNIQVDGFPAQTANPTYWGVVEGVSIRSGMTTESPVVELAEKPGAIDLSWRFGNGKVCAFAGVDTLEVAIWDDHSNKIYQEILPCAPKLLVEDVEQTPPTEVLYESATGIVIDGLYSGEYQLQALAYEDGPDATPVYWATVHPQVDHAQLTMVELVLEPCNSMGICF